MGKFLALGHATRPSYGGPKIDPPDFPVDFALWNFASERNQEKHNRTGSEKARLMCELSLFVLLV